MPSKSNTTRLLMIILQPMFAGCFQPERSPLSGVGVFSKFIEMPNSSTAARASLGGDGGARLPDYGSRGCEHQRLSPQLGCKGDTTSEHLCSANSSSQVTFRDAEIKFSATGILPEPCRLLSAHRMNPEMQAFRATFAAERCQPFRTIRIECRAR